VYSKEVKNMETRQQLSLIAVVIIDIIVSAAIVLALGPYWAKPDPAILVPLLPLYMSPIAVLAMILMPTLLLLKIGWNEKITPRMLLFPLRLGFAYEFLLGGLEKLLDPAYLTSPGLIALGAASAPSPWVRGFMTGLMANYGLFLLTIAVGEALIGLSFLTGGFTRLGAFGGVLIQSTFLLLLGWLSASTFGVNFLGLLAFFVAGMYRSGRFLGLDQLWGPKLDKASNPVLRFLGWWA
jgi:uncharacterized membrane protein YphA (DoxX/SURF4 family)